MRRKILLSLVVFLILNCTLLINNSQSQWLQCEGIYGGTVYSYAISGSKIFAGTGWCYFKEFSRYKITN